MIALGPERASCHLFTYKEGMLAAVAHDLKLAVTAFKLHVEEAPGSGEEASRRVEGIFEVASIRVVTAMAGGAPSPGALAAPQHREIEANLREKVLHADRYPTIRVVATLPNATDVDATVDGRVTLHGVERPVPIDVRGSPEAGYEARARLHQPHFGVVPYTALFGTLRVQPDVDVLVTVPAGS